MNDSITRRSFMKRSVVTAVAASSLTIFSGLVNAQGHGNSGGSAFCSRTASKKTTEGVTELDYTCKLQKPADGSACTDEVVCGKKSDGTEVKVKCGSEAKCRTLDPNFP